MVRPGKERPMAHLVRAHEDVISLADARVNVKGPYRATDKARDEVSVESFGGHVHGKVCIADILSTSRRATPKKKKRNGSERDRQPPRHCVSLAMV